MFRLCETRLLRCNEANKKYGNLSRLRSNSRTSSHSIWRAGSRERASSGSPYLLAQALVS